MSVCCYSFLPLKSDAFLCLKISLLVKGSINYHYSHAYCVPGIVLYVLQQHHHIQSCRLLQYSCLENLMDGGAWKAAVHGVAEGQTRLSHFTFTFHFHASEKEMATHSSALAWRIPGGGGAWWAAVYGGRTESDTTEVIWSHLILAYLILLKTYVRIIIFILQNSKP